MATETKIWKPGTIHKSPVSNAPRRIWNISTFCEITGENISKVIRYAKNQKALYYPQLPDGCIVLAALSKKDLEAYCYRI